MVRADSATDSDDEPLSPLLAYDGDDTLRLRLLRHASATPAASPDPLHSGLYYFRHSDEAYLRYSARPHRVTRGIDLDWALEISECVNATHCAQLGKPESSSFRTSLRDTANPLFNEINSLSRDIIVHFGNMPAWLSSCAQKNVSEPSICNAAWGCGNRRFSTYPPNDALAPSAKRARRCARARGYRASAASIHAYA